MLGLIPHPAEIVREHGEFVLDERTAVVAGPGAGTAAESLRRGIQPATGLPLPIHDPSTSADVDARRIVLRLDADAAAEAYRLVVTPEEILLSGGEIGLLHGVQTLRQLLPPQIFALARWDGVRWTVPCVRIVDAPRFAWRGVMLDVARHFMPPRELMRAIDLFALHRINRLHLHLTDDQGWRVQIAAHPRLTEVGGWRAATAHGRGESARLDGRPHGGWYTRAQLREIVGYAAERGIEVIPEIDLPGHSTAAIAAYPELGVTGLQIGVRQGWGVAADVLNLEASTVRFFSDVIDELVEVFPSGFVGAGGDECPPGQWLADPRTRELMRERGSQTATQAQTWFMNEIAAHLSSRGRRMLAWDEVLAGEPAPSTVVLAWRSLSRVTEAAVRGYDVVACPNGTAYLDARQSCDPAEPVPWSFLITLEDAYRFDPVPPGLEAAAAAHVLGGQANVWTEHLDNARAVDYMVFPRLCAIADALWRTTPADFDGFRDDLAIHLRRLDALGVEYRRASGPLPWQSRPDVVAQP